MMFISIIILTEVEFIKDLNVILAGHILTTLENVTSTYLQKPIAMKALDPANHHTQTQQQLLPQYLTKLQTTFSRH